MQEHPLSETLWAKRERLRQKKKRIGISVC